MKSDVKEKNISASFMAGDSLVAQWVENLTTMQEIQVRSLG